MGGFIIFRIADYNDLQFIESLENSLFSLGVQSSKESIVRSIDSRIQTVLIQSNGTTDIGCMIYFTYKKSFRIYSLGVDKAHQGNGYGKKFVNYLKDLSVKKEMDILIEVDASNSNLIHFYNNLGFTYLKTLKDYYGPSFDGVKMIYKVDKSKNSLQNLVIIEYDLPWLANIGGVKVITANDYITNEFYSDFKGRIYNLCDSYKYQTIGYYVSLLAVARDNRVIPNVSTLKDFKNKSILRSISDDVDEQIQDELKMLSFSKFSIKIYFGYVKDKKYQKIANELFQLFETPFLEIEFQKYDKWLVNKAIPFSKSSIQSEDYAFVNECAKKYFALKKHSIKTLKYYLYDLAILVNDEEATPPSDKKALSLFKKAAEEIGFYVEFITKKDYRRISEFDALFIRETTNVNNYTYDFARYAYSEGLIVLDDPWSILKCSNKIYLYERLKKLNINTPNTFIINQSQFKAKDYKNLKYPLILKEPDSSFSKGVFKVMNYDEFIKTVKALFSSSQIILAQEFIKSDFDWRIGFLDDQPLYACKYYMVKNHWQIYDWKNEENPDGDYEAFKISDVPLNVLASAQKAASSIGTGFYGVDLKEVNGEVYLIEVNDNPSIDYGVEDTIEGFELYKKIMNYFLDNIEYERNKIRYVSESK